MNRSECPDVSPVTPELWDRIRAGLKKQPDMACPTVHFQYTTCHLNPCGLKLAKGNLMW